MSNADNRTILVDPIVYIILRVYSPERIPISEFGGFNKSIGVKESPLMSFFLSPQLILET